MIIPLGRPLPGGSSHPPARSGGRPVRHKAASRAYMMLLRMGFGLPRLSPAARWALTPPFHPCPGRPSPARAVCFLCHCPSPSAAVWETHKHALSRLAVSQHPARWSPDFPPGCPGDHPTRSDGECTTEAPGPMMGLSGGPWARAADRERRAVSGDRHRPR